MKVRNLICRRKGSLQSCFFRI